MITLLRYRVNGALPYIFIHDIKINLDYKKASRLQICHRCQQHKRNWGQILPLVSLIPAAVLPPVSLTPVVHLDLRISPQIFEKIWNDPNVIFRGLGEGDSWKNLKQKISWHCPFKCAHSISVEDLHRFDADQDPDPDRHHNDASYSKFFTCWEIKF